LLLDNTEDNCVFKKLSFYKMQDEFLSRLIDEDDDFEDTTDDDLSNDDMEENGDETINEDEDDVEPAEEDE